MKDSLKPLCIIGLAIKFFSEKKNALVLAITGATFINKEKNRWMISITI